MEIKRTKLQPFRPCELVYLLCLIFCVCNCLLCFVLCLIRSKKRLFYAESFVCTSLKLSQTFPENTTDLSLNSDDQIRHFFDSVSNT